MKSLALLTTVALCLVVNATDTLAAQTAVVELRNSSGDGIGTAILTAAPVGVKIVVGVHGLPPGRHGFHIHNVGRCEPPAFASAGGHFNPLGKQHGFMNPQGMHAGDQPNLIVAADGTARVEVYAMHVTLGDGPNSLYHSGGTALVVHASADDEATDPAGNAGARIACGVVTR